MSITETTDSVKIERDAIAPKINDNAAISTAEQTLTHPREDSFAHTQPQSANNGMAVASLILGIVSICFFWEISFVTIPASIIGLVLGIISRQRQKDGVGLAGIILSVIALVFSLICFAILIVPFIILWIGLSN
jgi:hypothetical protein